MWHELGRTQWVTLERNQSGYDTHLSILAVYVDVRDGNCANLAMQLGPAAVMGTAVVPRSWQIRVTQYDCAFDNLAPAGCTQYFFGPTSQAVQGRGSIAFLNNPYPLTQ